MTHAPAELVVLSMPEIGALALRAARGAGLSWGMAEECGYAGVWLAQHDLPWSDAILARLQGTRGAGLDPVAGQWQATGPVCGLHAGVALAEAAHLPEGPLGAGVGIGEVLDPICMLPFVARAAQITGKTLDILAEDALCARLGREGMRALADPPGLAAIRVQVGADEQGKPPKAWPKATTAAVPKARYIQLEALGLQMTVPATAQSQAGAGAAGSDND